MTTKNSTMKYYVEAYYEDGAQILGNCDRQGVIYAKQYKRTDHYKSLKHGSSRVHSYKILTPNNQVIEVIKNLNYKDRG